MRLTYACPFSATIARATIPITILYAIFLICRAITGKTCIYRPSLNHTHKLLLPTYPTLSPIPSHPTQFPVPTAQNAFSLILSRKRPHPRPPVPNL